MTRADCYSVSFIIRGTVSFMVLSVSCYCHCQFHDNVSFMALSVSCYCQFHATVSFMILLLVSCY